MTKKLVVILGPTSAGKSSLSLKLAKKFQGEIISADSRQVYRGMDLGTGKVTKKEQQIVRHHLLDVASPKKQFTVSEFRRLTNAAIAKIFNRGKIPFLVGGTPFYIYAVIDGWQIPEVKPDLKLRKQLGRKSPAELFARLKKLDPVRAKTIDRNNPRRLIRAIEIIKSTGQAVPPFSTLTPFPFPLILGLKKDFPVLYKLIDNRLEDRLKAGMVAEVKQLLKQGVTHQRLQEMGLEYRFVSLYLQRKLSYEEMKAQLKTAIHKFSKRQMTWFKKDSRIHWVKNPKQADKLLRKYLRN